MANEPAAPDSNELVDLVNESDRVTGQASRREAHNHGWLHRAVHVLTFDPAGRLLLQKRAAGKQFNPGRWTSTASGHVTAGDSYDAAAAREVVEELQLSRPPTLERVGKVRTDTVDPETGQACRTLSTVYTTHLTIPAAGIRPQPSEVTKIEAFPLPGVVAAVRGEARLNCADGEPVPFADNFAPVVELLASTEKASDGNGESQARHFEPLCLECGAKMVESDRLLDDGALFIWYECTRARDGCTGQWLIKRALGNEKTG